jgi:hypothetical protein
VSPLQRYLDLYHQIRLLIAEGLGESDEADALRDRTDTPWWEMTPEDHIAFTEGVRRGDG